MQALSNVRSILPGFWPSFGYTVLYLSLIVLIPLSAVFLKSVSSSWAHFWKAVTSPDVLASYRLSFGASLVAALINVVFGFLVAWVLVRYEFPGKALVDALVDLPFALPTAVAGIALTSLYAENGWLGRYLAPLGIKVAFTPLGVIVALTFIGLPFVVRSVQPVLADADQELEEAAASLGASRWQVFSRVIFPLVRPALLTGFALAFARALGEYGSVIFISGNLPMQTEITPLLIVTKLEQYDYAGATAIAVVMLVASFVLLLGDQRAAAAYAAGSWRPTERDRWRRTRTSAQIGTIRRSVRWGLTLLALAALGLFIVLPLVAVFVQAFEKGWAAYLAAIREPDTLSAIQLTLLTAGIAVPLNLVFGLAAAWAITKFQFQGQERSGHADRPSLRRLAGDLRPDLTCWCSARRAGSAPGWPITTSRSSSPCRASCWPPFS